MPQQARSSSLLLALNTEFLQNSWYSTNRRTVSTLKQHSRQNIMTQISNMQSVSFGDGNSNCGNISSISNTFNISDEDAAIMRWLSPLEPNNRHQGVRTERFDGVGNWLLETTEFREWRYSEGGADKAVLFCSGNPGVGKTYLR